LPYGNRFLKTGSFPFAIPYLDLLDVSVKQLSNEASPDLDTLLNPSYLLHRWLLGGIVFRRHISVKIIGKRKT